MKNYLDAPIWDSSLPGCSRKEVPSTCPSAEPVEYILAKGQTVIDIKYGMYRNAEVSGVFLLDSSVKLPLSKIGRKRIRVNCLWFGHRLESGRGLSMLVELSTATVIENYSGEIVSNIARSNS